MSAVPRRGGGGGGGGEYGSVRRRVGHVVSYDSCDTALLFCSEERVVAPKSVPGSEEPLFGSDEPILDSEEPIFAPKSVSYSEEHHFAYRRFIDASWLRCRVAADTVSVTSSSCGLILARCKAA